MDRKYQKALDFLLTYPRIIQTENGVSVEALANARENLQELIDKYAELEKALNFACYIISKSNQRQSVIGNLAEEKKVILNTIKGSRYWYQQRYIDYFEEELAKEQNNG